MNWERPKLAAGEKIVMMTPDAVLKEMPTPCGYRHGQRIPTAYEHRSRKECWIGGSVTHLTKTAKKDEPLSPPWLDYTRPFFGFPKHEGRHTAYVAKMLGEKKIPVVVRRRSSSRS